MNIFKSFVLFNINEQLLNVKGIIFKYRYPKDKFIAELEKKSSRSFDFINSILEELKHKTKKEKRNIQITFHKEKKEVTKEEYNKFIKSFKYPDNILETNKWIPLFFDDYVEKTSKITLIKATANNLKIQIEKWNKKYQNIFKFDNDISKQVNNPVQVNGALDALAKLIIPFKEILTKLSISFVGHTSSPGDTQHNLKLSQGRAQTAKNMFVSKYPKLAKAASITSKGKGETELLYKDDVNNPKKQQLNRRVAIEVNTNTQVSDDIHKTESKTYTIIVYKMYIDLNAYGSGKPPKIIKPPNIKAAQKRIQCPKPK